MKPKNPNSADIGGLHLRLDQDEITFMECTLFSQKFYYIYDRPAQRVDDKQLQQWMDEAKDGFIYVSFGSVSTVQ